MAADEHSVDETPGPADPTEAPEIAEAPQPPDAAAVAPDVPQPSEATVPPPIRRHRRRWVALGLAIAVVAVTGTAGGSLVAWDAGYEGRILPGVHIGVLDVSGMDRRAAMDAVAAGYPYQAGRIVLRTPDGDLEVPYAAFGRRPDVDAAVDEALRSGREGGIPDRAVAEITQAVQGTTIPPTAIFDEALLTSAIAEALGPLNRAPVDATIAMGPDGPVTTTARAGRSVDPGPPTAAAIASVTGTDVPAEVVIPVSTSAVAPAIDDEAVANALFRSKLVVNDVAVTYGTKTWKIKTPTVRSWVTFTSRTDGSVGPAIDPSTIEASLTKAAKAVAKKPVSATFLKSRRGKVVGVARSHDGRRLDMEATVARIAAELAARGTGSPPEEVAVVVAKVAPKINTEEAQKTAPLMVKLGGWTTYFPISDRNYFGANIWRPAELINGTVLAPGQTFDWWRAIWPVTPARGFGPGGVIRTDHTDPTGALGGGMCSSSTTLFNAALRAGLKMGARSNHRYYINRYPLGLDATVSIMGGGRQTMTFTNDTRHPILIRAFKIRGAGGRGYVRYQIWGVPDGRTVTISRPAVANVREATTNTVTVSTLPHGVREQTEYPSNGMDVSVTRIVRNAKGRVIHSNTYRTHYVLWNGRIEVGA